MCFYFPVKLQKIIDRRKKSSRFLYFLFTSVAQELSAIPLVGVGVIPALFSFHTDPKDFKDGYASLRGRGGAVSEFLTRSPVSEFLTRLPVSERLNFS